MPGGNSTKTLAKLALEAREPWPEGKDPEPFLSPYELKAAELFFRCNLNFPAAIKRTASQRMEYEKTLIDLWPQHFGEKWNDNVRHQLEANEAFRPYLKKLRANISKMALERLTSQTMTAVDNFLWAQAEARSQGDYKETRIAAGDHLDRVGATKNPGHAQPAIVIVLRGRNFDVESMDRVLPDVSSEIVVEASEVESE